ncbi:MAG: cupredoxin domain-containing protein [Microthrixaceae bacterium]|nr:cupredoxin domain-containing protein [Microthrixaceae bacterium]
MRSRTLRTVVLALAVAVLLVGCGGSDNNADNANSGPAGLPTIPEKSWVDQTGKKKVVVDTRDNVYVPENIIVSPGTEIVFENTGRNPHNVIPAQKGDFEEIPVSKLQPKDSASITLDSEGEIPFYCSLHGTPKAGMKGRIKVSKG